MPCLTVARLVVDSCERTRRSQYLATGSRAPEGVLELAQGQLKFCNVRTSFQRPSGLGAGLIPRVPSGCGLLRRLPASSAFHLGVSAFGGGEYSTRIFALVNLFFHRRWPRGRGDSDQPALRRVACCSGLRLSSVPPFGGGEDSTRIFAVVNFFISASQPREAWRLRPLAFRPGDLPLRLPPLRLPVLRRGEVLYSTQGFGQGLFSSSGTPSSRSRSKQVDAATPWSGGHPAHVSRGRRSGWCEATASARRAR